MSRLSEREEQAAAVNEADRDDLDEKNPIVYAESAPNRFRTLSYFFPEGDGVEIVQDLDNDEEVSIFYFDNSGRVELESGALYQWALDKWEEDN